MASAAQQVETLFSKDNAAAYDALKALKELCAVSGGVYLFFDRFAGMLTNRNSYIRTRGLVLIAALARWDTEHKIDGVLDEYLRHIQDEKPITARQCIQALPEIACCRPELAGRIREALERVDFSGNRDSMQPLLLRDTIAALRKIGESTKKGG